MDQQRRNFLTLLGLGAAAMAGCNSMSDRGYKYVGETRYNRKPTTPPEATASTYPRYQPLPVPTTPAKPIISSGEMLLADAYAREIWADADPIESRLNPMQTPWRITLHHSGVFCEKEAREDVIEILRVFRKDHLSRLGAGDIAYHYIVDRSGHVWHGRDMKYQGAHVKDRNEGNIGVMVMGNFEDQSPTRAQLDAVYSIMPALMKRYSVELKHVYTHRELMDTLCPGRVLQGSFDGMRDRKFA